MAAVLQLLNGGRGPDLLGVCEVETRELAVALANRVRPGDYAVAHVDSPDLRGIDTSLIYSQQHFECVGVTPHLVHLRFRTRDIFEVELRVKANGARLFVLVNHWPSRRNQGAVASEPFRISVAGHCGRIVDSILKFSRQEVTSFRDSAAAMRRIADRWDRNILVMGDFNDEPFARSVMDEFGAVNSVDLLEEEFKKSSQRAYLPDVASYLKRNAALFNYAWEQIG